MKGDWISFSPFEKEKIEGIEGEKKDRRNRIKKMKRFEYVIRVYPIDTPKQAKIPFHICRKTIVKHFKIFHNPIDITNDYNVK